MKAMDKFWENIGPEVQVDWDDELYLSTIIGSDGAVDQEQTAKLQKLEKDLNEAADVLNDLQMKAAGIKEEKAKEAKEAKERAALEKKAQQELEA